MTSEKLTKKAFSKQNKVSSYQGRTYNGADRGFNPCQLLFSPYAQPHMLAEADQGSPVYLVVYRNIAISIVGTLYRPVYMVIFH